jgi:hypothetical protein
MLALILLLTLVVMMLNVAELAPAGTVTFAGTPLLSVYCLPASLPNR